MSGVNKCIFVGNITKEVVVFTFDNGTKKTSFCIAVNESYKNKQGEKIENVEFINIVCWRNLAEVAETYLKKGMQIYIEGKLKTRMWEKDGQKHYTTEVYADQMQMLSKKEAIQGTQTNEPKAEPENDLPF